MTVIGIDPGLNGGFAILKDDGSIETFKMPLIIAGILDIKLIANILKKYKSKDCFLVLENVHALFGSSAAATFTFGHVCGALESLVVLSEIPFIKCGPKEWQKLAYLGIKEIRKPSKIDAKGKEKKGAIETKMMSLVAATRLYPNADYHKTPKSKKEHDGIVDALLIAHYGKHYKS